MNPSDLDFGYTWPWTHGHLVFAALLGALSLLVWARTRSRWGAGALTAGAIWMLAGFLIVRYVFAANATLPPPPGAFLQSPGGRVLDLGSGSGRAALMVLSNRPGTTVVALDNWSAGYIDANGPARLMANLRVARVDHRAEVRDGDMRALPFDASSFDAIVSTYAIDHLDEQGIRQALAEARRVLRPGGQLLVLVMNHDLWVTAAYGPLYGLHGRRTTPSYWRAQLVGAGFRVIEEGTSPGTAYFLGGG